MFTGQLLVYMLNIRVRQNLFGSFKDEVNRHTDGQKQSPLCSLQALCLVCFWTTDVLKLLFIIPVAWIHLIAQIICY